MKARFLSASAAVFALAALIPAAASAEPYDHSFDRPHSEREIVGRVAWFRPYRLELNDDRHVVLHDGTVINPRGITLHRGMLVRVVGHDSERGNFSADEINLIRRPFDER